MPPIIYGDGEQTRDFVYVEDVAEANMLALSCRSAVGKVFNIATGTSVSVNEVADALKKIMNKKDLENIHTDPRITDIRHGYADITKAKEMLGFRPKVYLKEGLTKLVDWYKNSAKC